MGIFALVLVFATSSAASTPALTLEDAIARSQAHDLRRAFVNDDGERATWAAHRSLTRVLPTLSLGASVTQNPSEIKINQNVVTPLVLPQANARAALSLFRGPNIPNAIAGYLDADATHVGNRERLQALSHDVAHRFLALAEANALVSAGEQILVRAAALVELTQVRVDLGEAVPLEVENARAELLRVKAEVALIDGERRAAEVRLREVIGDVDTAALAVTCDACVPEVSSAKREKAERDDVDEANLRIDSAYVRQVGAWMTFLPNIDVVGTGRLQPATLFNPNVFWWNAQLVLSWEIFSGGLTLVNGFDAARATRRARLDARWLQRTAQNDTATAKVALDGGRAVMRAAIARQAAAAAALAFARAAFDEGEVNSLVVTEAARNLSDADTALVQARFRLLRARLYLRRAAGLDPVASATNAAPQRAP